MRAWKPRKVETLFTHPLFTLKRQRVVADEDERVALVLEAPDWVNIIPLLPDGRVLMVRQWRYGLEAPTLEIPGGLVEDEEPQAAAERELLEETGYRARTWRLLGEMHPNPAFLTNRITTYLATDLEQIGPPEGDGEEEIELETAPLADVPRLIRSGVITHSLVVAAFYLHGLEVGSSADGDEGRG